MPSTFLLLYQGWDTAFCFGMAHILRFLHFSCKNKSKEENFITQENYMKFKSHCPKISHTHILPMATFTLYDTQRTHGPQSLKYLLSRHLQEKFADPHSSSIFANPFLFAWSSLHLPQSSNLFYSRILSVFYFIFFLYSHFLSFSSLSLLFGGGDTSDTNGYVNRTPYSIDHHANVFDVQPFYVFF